MERKRDSNTQLTYKCVICHKTFVGYGNNPRPLAQHGRCCDVCNQAVIAERLRLMQQWR